MSEPINFGQLTAWRLKNIRQPLSKKSYLMVSRFHTSMPAKRTVASLFQGKKPKALWGGASRKQRERYGNRSGLRKSNRDMTLLKAKAMLQKIDLEPNSQNRSKKQFYFLLDHFFSREARRLHRELFPKYDMEEWSTKEGISHAITRLLNQQPSMSKNMLLKKIQSVKRELGQAYFKIEKMTFAADPLSTHPVESATVRHSLISPLNFMRDQLDRIEAILKTLSRGK